MWLFLKIFLDQDIVIVVVVVLIDILRLYRVRAQCTRDIWRKLIDRPCWRIASKIGHLRDIRDLSMEESPLDTYP